jgi:hypothetical protein
MILEVKYQGDDDTQPTRIYVKQQNGAHKKRAQILGIPKQLPKKLEYYDFWHCDSRPLQLMKRKYISKSFWLATNEFWLLIIQKL